MAAKIPLTLVTGFLGSGKTSFLQNYLSHRAGSGKVAVIQNEFADSGIDGEILMAQDDGLILSELRRGSIFCRCLFSSFLNVLIDLASQKNEADEVLIEATGIADPIAIAQVFENEKVRERYYLQRIVTIVDAVRFKLALQNIIAVRHQIEVADVVLINKVDLVSSGKLEEVVSGVSELNPFAQVLFSTYGRFNPADLEEREILSCVGKKGELTRCGEGNYISSIFRKNSWIPESDVMIFLDSLDERILRLKGYVTCEGGKCYMIQYVPGQIEMTPVQKKTGKVELISVGYVEPDFLLLSR